MNETHSHRKHPELVKPVNSENTPVLAGLILAGGESRRMGFDKSVIPYHGMPHSEYMWNLLKKFTPDVYLSSHPLRTPDTGIPLIKDTFLDLGPYGGVLSAFRFQPNNAWFAVACDIPMLDEQLLSELIESRDPSKVATCFHDPSTGLPEPLITIWEPKAYQILLQNLGQGVSCLRKVLINTDSKKINTGNPERLRNANTPEESERFKKMMTSFPEDK